MDKDDNTEVPAAAVSSGRPRARPDEIASGVRRILIRSGRPLKTNHLLPLLEKEGIVVQGWSRSSVLGVILRRRLLADGTREFISIPGGYWLSDVQRPVPLPRRR
jgi:hypothetical protein